MTQLECSTIIHLVIMNNILVKQIKAIINKDLPLVSNLSNVSALLNTLEDLNWAGFYLVKEDKLYLGPFQGEVACTVIPYGKGVCGTAFKEKKTIIVPDVSKFEGHIACSSLSKSEIVTPIMKGKDVVGVIDIDSPSLKRFGDKEKALLEKVAKALSTVF